jgi:hypothetical protein
MAATNPNDAEAGPQSPTALIPLNALGGQSPEVGSLCQFRVVQVYDDQVEVEYVGSGESEEAEPEAEMEAGEMTGYLE